MPHRTTRRAFVQTSAAAGLGFWVAGGVQAQESKSPNERIAMASIGIGGKGDSDSSDAGRAGDMVAICDIDDARLEGIGRRFAKAKKFNDFRKMLDEMGKSIDAVTVSTPDHMHAPAALMAMRMGKHAFIQKPLTRCIYEARLLAEVARKHKVATQMGNQGTANDSLRKAAGLLRSKTIGAVKEVHVWTNRPIWPQGVKRPQTKECPAHVHWDLWLGCAAERPYADGYHPFAWRGWWDFGSGALGDMACHTVNMPYMGLELKNPTAVQAITSGHNKDSYPAWSEIHFDFPANAWRGALKFFWYDGGKAPRDELMDVMAKHYAKELEKDKNYLKTGCIAVGEKGYLFSPGDYAEKKVKLSNAEELPEVEYVKSPGHFQEWIRAIKGGEPARSNCPDYSGGLTETILLGNLAVFAADKANSMGPKVEWDAVNLKCTNMPELMAIVKPTYRKGYVLDV
jgi:predicted dehydrogenase